jgi:hypothetical protein
LKCGEEGCGRRSDNPVSFRKYLKTIDLGFKITISLNLKY